MIGSQFVVTTGQRTVLLTPGGSSTAYQVPVSAPGAQFIRFEDAWSGQPAQDITVAFGDLTVTAGPTDQPAGQLFPISSGGYFALYAPVNHPQGRPAIKIVTGY